MPTLTQAFEECVRSLRLVVSYIPEMPDEQVRELLREAFEIQDGLMEIEQVLDSAVVEIEKRLGGKKNDA